MIRHLPDGCSHTTLIRLDKALSNLIQWAASLQGLGARWSARSLPAQGFLCWFYEDYSRHTLPHLWFIYSHLKKTTLERAETFMAFCLLLYVIYKIQWFYILWHLPVGFTIEKPFKPLQIYSVGAAQADRLKWWTEQPPEEYQHLLPWAGQALLLSSKNNPSEVRRSTHGHKGKHLVVEHKGKFHTVTFIHFFYFLF